MTAEQRANSSNHSRAVRIFQYQHNTVWSRFYRTAVNTYNSGSGAEESATNRNNLSFARSGQFEHIGIISSRAQTRFAHFQAKSFRKTGRVYFVDFAAAGYLQEAFQDGARDCRRIN